LSALVELRVAAPARRRAHRPELGIEAGERILANRVVGGERPRLAPRRRRVELEPGSAGAGDLLLALAEDLEQPPARRDAADRLARCQR
jgi:hypothetical protein